MKDLKIAVVSPEVAPFSKTGGLGDVAGSLPAFLSKKGAKVTVITPLYKDTETSGTRHLAQAPFIINGKEKNVEFLETRLPGSDVNVIFINSPEDFRRNGIYGDSDGEYPDNPIRFGLFCQASILAAHRWVEPDIIHLHDWTTGLIPAYLRTGNQFGHILDDAKIVFTIHNLAYQGVFDPSFMEPLGLDPSLFHWKLLEFWGKFSFLKAGIIYSDLVTTVSPSYAREVQEPEFGFGMDGVLRENSHKLIGILNGVNYNEWNPETDPYIRRNFGISRMQGKATNKNELRKMFGLQKTKDTPILAMVSRLTWQKGVDLLLNTSKKILEKGAQLVILGKGEKEFEDRAIQMAKDFSGRFSARIGFDMPLSHLIIAGADMLLVPSRFEPCGLTPLYGLKYGTIPVARATGGLRDTLVDFDSAPTFNEANAFLYEEQTEEGFLGAVERATKVFHSRKKVKGKTLWNAFRSNCMKQDWSWDRQAEEYMSAFFSLVGKESLHLPAVDADYNMEKTENLGEETRR